MQNLKNVESNNPMEMLKFNLKRQNEQGEAIVQAIEHIDEVKNDMDEKYQHTFQMLKEVKNRIHLEEGDCLKIKSLVAKKAHRISKKRWGNLQDYGAEYREMVGFARRTVYKKLKHYFNVNKYTQIRHIDRDEAFRFVDSIMLGSEFLMEYEKWREQRIKKELREKQSPQG